MIKVRQKVGCLRTLSGAEQFCAIRSYLPTARKQGTHFFDSLTMLAEGNPWLPATAWPDQLPWRNELWVFDVAMFLLPALGVVMWIAHVVQMVSQRGRIWGLLGALVALPVLCVIAFVCWIIFSPRPPPGSGIVSLTFSPKEAFLLVNAFAGMALWVVFVIFEPVLYFIALAVRRRRERA